MSEADFYKMRRLPPYVLAEVNRVRAARRARGADVIDFGMGNPDLEPPPHVIEKLVETARKPRAHRYSASRGVPGLRRSLARYYQSRFDVTLDPETEVVATLGSKEGFANIAQAISAPGDVVLAPDPSYPIHTFGFIIAGGSIRNVRAPDAETYLRGLDHAARHCVPSPIAVVVCYPSNPTAQTADLEVYAEINRIAARHDMLILSDLAYAEVYFDGTPPPSMLQVPGARARTIETTSLSKTYSMAGFRVGFAAGAPHLIAALARVKSYLDYGGHTPIQVAACAALDGPQDYVETMRETYHSRRDALVESFARAGWTIPSPSASMFAWAPLPEPFAADGSLAFAKMLIEEAGVAVAPGVGFGEHGEGFVRIALVENEQRIRQAARALKPILQRGPGARAAE